MEINVLSSFLTNDYILSERVIRDPSVSSLSDMEELDSISMRISGVKCPGHGRG